MNCKRMKKPNCWISMAAPHSERERGFCVHREEFQFHFFLEKIEEFSLLFFFFLFSSENYVSATHSFGDFCVKNYELCIMLEN